MIPKAFHPFRQDIQEIELPLQFTYPFHYTPHPLCILAAGEVQSYLSGQTEWKAELDQGKMFGVLPVQTSTGETGFLAAFSGVLAGSNQHDYFVTPVYDLLDPRGFFTEEEAKISRINQQIMAIDDDPETQKIRQALYYIQHQALQETVAAREALKTAREKREHLRQSGLSETETAELIRESQHQKAEFKRMKTIWAEKEAAAKSAVQQIEQQITTLKNERKQRSAALQLRLFNQFIVRNANQESRCITDLFRDTPQQIPPAGTAECAAPRLLQYAYLHDLKPLAMAEFWWGKSPEGEIRRHGNYYPACKHKCEPVLQFMLRGLEVEPNPLQVDLHAEVTLEILYEDEWILAIHKPAGMLSVPGKLDCNSVQQQISKAYPEASGPLLVHRLDMDTSGILLIAKTKPVHQQLQAQFAKRTVEKRYEAILNGIVSADEGFINLSMRPDPTDRPRQVVDAIHGKPAETRFRVLSREKEETRILFYPKTGRTHQLRVHAAHQEGLNAPIKGDSLYGKKADRLYLHAAALTFTHPISEKRITIEKTAEF